MMENEQETAVVTAVEVTSVKVWQPPTKQQRMHARWATIQAFRRFLKLLDAELTLYGYGVEQHELTAILFRGVRKMARSLRDEPPQKAYESVLVTFLDTTLRWDEWTLRLPAGSVARTLHETEARMVKGIIKGWRSYRIWSELPDSRQATPAELKTIEKEEAE